MTARLAAIPVLLALVAAVPADIEGSTGNGKVTLTGVEINGPISAPSQGPDRRSPVVAAPTVENRIVIDCPGNTLDGPDETLSCQSAVNACRNNSEGPGPRATVYSRPVGSTTWTPTAKTCLPGSFAAPTPGVLTLGEIRRAFHETPFATPTGSIQPVGGATLVNLPTYFTLTWPDTGGYRPGQTRALTLLGHTIDLRLKLAGHTYHFGDGTSTGPTTSPGGPHPTGDITHTYTRATTLTPTATTTITADYRIDAGPWQPLPGTSTHTTTFPVLTIHTATNRLLPDPT